VSLFFSFLFSPSIISYSHFLWFQFSLSSVSLSPVLTSFNRYRLQRLYIVKWDEKMTIISRIWKESVVLWFTVLSQILSSETEENHEDITVSGNQLRFKLGTSLIHVQSLSLLCPAPQFLFFLLLSPVFFFWFASVLLWRDGLCM
jgi:hypothetical protein